MNHDNSSSGASQRIRRRDEYAQATRQAIVDAARQLFSQHGYFSTKVDDIATLARVAPATVYAVSGGKHGLLGTLMEIWTTAPIVAATIGSIESMKDPKSILRLVASACRQMREEFGERATVAVIPDVSHALIQEQPAAVAAAILAWIGKLPP